MICVDVRVLCSMVAILVKCAFNTADIRSIYTPSTGHRYGIPTWSQKHLFSVFKLCYRGLYPKITWPGANFLRRFCPSFWVIQERWSGLLPEKYNFYYILEIQYVIDGKQLPGKFLFLFI